MTNRSVGRQEVPDGSATRTLRPPNVASHADSAWRRSSRHQAGAPRRDVPFVELPIARRPNDLLGNVASGSITTALDARVFELVLKLGFVELT